jgi:hypothetical protein
MNRKSNTEPCHATVPDRIHRSHRLHTPYTVHIHCPVAKGTRRFANSSLEAASGVSISASARFRIRG